MSAKKYTSDDIRMFSGLDKVRQFPTMYIGDTADTGLYLILREPKDNVIDEVTAGRATHLQYSIPVKGESAYWVLDDGQGIPQGIKEVPVEVSGKTVISKMPTMQAVFGELHTSGKHSEAYGASIGVHGVGIKGTNALSKVFEVWTCYKKVWYHIAFAKGKIKTQGVVQQKPPADTPFGKVKSGTLIRYEPDTTIFTARRFAESLALDWSEITAYLNPGTKITHRHGKNVREFFSKRGPIEYLEKTIERLKCKPLLEDQVMNIEVKVPGYESGDGTNLPPGSAIVVLAFTDYDGVGLHGFTNGLFNGDGGVHVNSVTQGLLKAVKEHAKRGQDFTGHELRDGLVGLVNARLQGARFSSQAKVKLTDERMSDAFSNLFYESAKKFFKKHKDLAAAICERAARLKKLKSEFKASKEVVKEINKAKKVGLSSKYAGPKPWVKPQDVELILVEGDSASGGLKEARKDHQAILPLRGKILNALKSDKALSSAEVIDILVAIGFDPKAKDVYEKLRVGRITCLADPDPDGPFVAGTKVQVVLEDGAPWVGPIEELVGKNVFVPTVTKINNGKSLSVKKRAEATVIQAGTTTTLVALELVAGNGKIKYKVDEGHKWPVLNYKPHDVREGRVELCEQTGLAFKAAKDIRPGDFIAHVDYTGGIRVSKAKTQKLKEAIPVYCFNVPGTRNFILPCGTVSSNCHINTLLLTLFYRYLPGLFERGMIYVVQAPEFYSMHKDVPIGGATVSQVRDQMKAKGVKNPTIYHIKGWGEVDKEQLTYFALEDATRNLIQIKLDPNGNIDFERLMNEDVQYRRTLIGISDDEKA